jgi:hypothetical protein
MDVRMWIGLIWFWVKRDSGNCEHGNELVVPQIFANIMTKWKIINPPRKITLHGVSDTGWGRNSEVLKIGMKFYGTKVLQSEYHVLTKFYIFKVRPPDDRHDVECTGGRELKSYVCVLDAFLLKCGQPSA